MKFTTAAIAAVGSLASLAQGRKDDSTFAVLRFNGQEFLTEGMVDPIVDPGKESSHYHVINGGNKFGKTIQGNQLLDSTCTNAKIANDFSNYWVPALFFQDPNNPSNFTKVPVMYMNVYYFFEPTNDDLVPFPPGLKMLVGDPFTRSPPKGGGAHNVDPDKGPIQPVQWTCPRQNYDPPSYPADSDGSMAGIQDPGNDGAGAGFPLHDCDGTYSPLRGDIHFPSCYDPSKGLDNYKENMAWPRTGSDGKLDCPKGYIHVPHIFFEVYYKSHDFKDAWTPDGKTQPFVLSTGDATGYGFHGDFVAGWVDETLRAIINTCNAGTLGMDRCPNIPGGTTDPNKVCTIDSPAPAGTLMGNTAGKCVDKLPGNNKVTGFGKGGVTGGEYGRPHGGDDTSDSTSYPTNTPAPTTESPSTYQTPTPAPTTYAGGADAGAGTAVAQPPPETTPAPSYPEQGGDSGAVHVETIWDIVTVTATETEWVDTYPTAKRRRHEHLARHQHHR